MTEYLPQTDTPTSGSEKAEQNSQVNYNCRLCSDKGRVTVRLETWSGPFMREIACPDCGGGHIKLEDFRDQRTHQLAKELLSTREEIQKLRTAILVIIGLAALIYMLNRGESPRQAFAKATEEVTAP